eukprot:1459852-Pyramimonas_sp.AAC.1
MRPRPPGFLWRCNLRQDVARRGVQGNFAARQCAFGFLETWDWPSGVSGDKRICYGLSRGTREFPLATGTLPPSHVVYRSPRVSFQAVLAYSMSAAC